MVRRGCLLMNGLLGAEVAIASGSKASWRIPYWRPFAFIGSSVTTLKKKKYPAPRAKGFYPRTMAILN
jgi:hypothetical protein